MSANAADVIPDSALVSQPPSAVDDVIPPHSLNAVPASNSFSLAATPLGHAAAIGENMLSGITGGAGSLADAVTGADPGTHDWAYRPRTAEGKALSNVISMGGGAVNEDVSKLGGSFVGLASNPTNAQAMTDTLRERIPEALGAVGTITGAGSLAKGALIKAPAEVPSMGSVAPEAATDRAGVLQRVGIENARNSALNADPKSAATDFQLSKFDEPAGVAAKAQFDAEKEALNNHAHSIIDDTGGTVGTDEDTLNSRGQTIAAPFDRLRTYFENQKQAAYSAADERAAGKPISSLSSTSNLLKDPDFTETLMAKDQGGLLNSIQRQFQRFQALNPEGMTVENAENFRKWLNQVWTPENSATLGKVKGALDQDVFKNAGEDIYGPARKIVQAEAQTLDNPNGVSKLMDFDPQNPLNRTTPHAKIPDTLTRLDPAQFDNVIRTLDSMPEAIQPEAQAAKAEIKAHLANKIADAGSSTQGQWDAPAVSKVIKANSAKLQSAFADQPEVLQKIQDLDSAGKILKVDQSYPGAAAQAANVLKRGGMSHALSKGASIAGGSIGGTAGAILAGPPGAAVGSTAGATIGGGIGNKLSEGAAERAALKKWQAGTTKLSEILKKPPE